MTVAKSLKKSSKPLQLGAQQLIPQDSTQQLLSHDSKQQLSLHELSQQHMMSSDSSQQLQQQLMSRDSIHQQLLSRDPGALRGQLKLSEYMYLDKNEAMQRSNQHLYGSQNKLPKPTTGFSIEEIMKH